MNRKTIGIFGASMLEWGGGVDLLKNIIHALHYDPQEYDIRLLVPVVGSDMKTKLKRTAQKLLGRHVFEGIDPEVVASFTEEYPFVTVNNFVNSRDGLKTCIRENGISVLFPCAYPLGPIGIPWVGYLPDFQHKYLPEFFSREEIARRDETIGKRIEEAPALIVTSETAKQDILKYYPGCTKPIHVIPFSPAPRRAWLEAEGDVRTKYGFAEDMKYFLISNQFWIHKDHPCAFRALARLHAQNGYQDLHIVCTGATEDYRNPDYLKELQAANQELGIGDHVHFLGYIPKADQILLMKHSIGVIQPTLYEGSPGGGEIEDAVSLGIPSIVSDIPVNLEISEPTVTFFRKGDEADLAEKMKDFSDNVHPAPSISVLEEAGKRRQKVYHDVLYTMISTL